MLRISRSFKVICLDGYRNHAQNIDNSKFRCYTYKTKDIAEPKALSILRYCGFSVAKHEPTNRLSIINLALLFGLGARGLFFIYQVYTGKNKLSNRPNMATFGTKNNRAVKLPCCLVKKTITFAMQSEVKSLKDIMIIPQITPLVKWDSQASLKSFLPCRTPCQNRSCRSYKVHLQ